MNITDEILNRVESFGKKNYSPKQITVMMCLSADERQTFLDEMSDQESPLYLAYFRGLTIRDHEINQKLEELIEQGGEGSNDVARALSFRTKSRLIDDLKHELFGV